MIPGFCSRLFLCFCIFVPIFLSGCGTYMAAPAAATRTPVTTCILGENPYSKPVSNEVILIYSDFKKGMNINVSRQLAYSKLAEQSDLWSDYMDIFVNDELKIRLMITYIDSELIQYVILNHALLNSSLLNSASPNSLTYQNNLDEVGFEQDIRTILNKIAERNEMLFLVTIIASDGTGKTLGADFPTVRIPFSDMKLINGSDVEMYPTHDDHILNEPLQLNRGAVSGNIWYPVSVLTTNNNCVQIPDKWTNSLTFNIPSVKVGNEDRGAHYWSLPYAPLIERGPNHPSLTPNTALGVNGNVTIGYDLSTMVPNPNPPLPIVDMNDAGGAARYWQNVGSYIWYWLMVQGRH